MAGHSGPLQLPSCSFFSQPIGRVAFSPQGRRGCWQVPGRPDSERVVCRCMPPRTETASTRVATSRACRRARVNGTAGEARSRRANAESIKRNAPAACGTRRNHQCKSLRVAAFVPSVAANSSATGSPGGVYKNKPKRAGAMLGGRGDGDAVHHSCTL
eukprot:scaffold133110_cov63-Phaeocystis_antarctica.AAC.2